MGSLQDKQHLIAQFVISQYVSIRQKELPILEHLQIPHPGTQAGMDTATPVDTGLKKWSKKKFTEWRKSQENGK